MSALCLPVPPSPRVIRVFPILELPLDPTHKNLKPCHGSPVGILDVGKIHKRRSDLTKLGRLYDDHGSFTFSDKVCQIGGRGGI